MFAVIQFTPEDGGTVSVVNKKWLTPRRSEVYWPPIKGTKAFEKLLPNGSLTPDEKWKLYGVQRIFYETDDIDKAKKKLKLAEVSSDIQTQSEEEPEERFKRKQIRNKRYISSEEEEERFERPPPLKKKFVQSFHSNNNINEEASLVDKTKRSTSEANNCSHDLSIKTSLLEDLERDFLSSAEDQQQVEKDNLNLTAYQEKVVSLLTIIKSQNDQILSILRQKTKGSLKTDFKFPLKTWQELAATEELLKNPDNFDNLVSYLETLGGRLGSGTVSRILKTIIDDCLAKDFNFYGKRSDKKPFCELFLRRCVVVSVKNASGATEKEIEDHIKVWLKHAPERLLKKERASQKGKELNG